MSRTIAIMTGGGDAPGLNAVIRAVVKRSVTQLGWKVLGIEDSFDGLFEEPLGVHSMDRDTVRGILRLGGTILGTTNRGNPFDAPDRAAEVTRRLRALGVDGLIACGGEGTMGICWRLMRETGMPVIGVPKTIDNDIPFTDVTFGFDTAMSYATDAVDRLHTTAEAHERVMVLELMGRHAGFLALHAGVAGGADVILIPEIPFRLDAVLGKLQRRSLKKRVFSIVVVSEGARPDGGDLFYRSDSGPGSLKLGGVGRYVAEEIARRTPFDTRFIVLGHLQRGGSPTAFDRILATRCGNHAVDLALANHWGRMVAVVDGRMSSVPLEAVGEAPARQVTPDDDTLLAARGLGIVFGDEA